MEYYCFGMVRVIFHNTNHIISERLCFLTTATNCMVLEVMSKILGQNTAYMGMFCKYGVCGILNGSIYCDANE